MHSQKEAVLCFKKVLEKENRVSKKQNTCDHDSRQNSAFFGVPSPLEFLELSSVEFSILSPRFSVRFFRTEEDAPKGGEKMCEICVPAERPKDGEKMCEICVPAEHPENRGVRGRDGGSVSGALWAPGSRVLKRCPESATLGASSNTPEPRARRALETLPPTLLQTSRLSGTHCWTLPT